MVIKKTYTAPNNGILYLQGVCSTDDIINLSVSVGGISHRTFRTDNTGGLSEPITVYVNEGQIIKINEYTNISSLWQTFLYLINANF